MEPQRNYQLSTRVIFLWLALSCGGATVAWGAGAGQSRPAAPRRMTPQAQPALSLPQDVTVTDPCALPGVSAGRVRAAEAKVESQDPESKREARGPMARELWSGRITAPEASDEAQTSLALKRLIRQVRVMTLNEKGPAAQAAATVESSATAKAPKAVAPNTESVTPAPPEPGAAAASETTSAGASQRQKTLEGLRKNAGRVRDPLEVAELLFLSGRPTEAVPFYEEALRRTSAGDAAAGADRAWILFQLGNCLRESDATKAQDAYTKLIAEFPSSPWTEMARASGQLVAWYQSARPDQLLAPPKP